MTILSEKRELLQLMKDLVRVEDNVEGDVIQTEIKYRALGCEIRDLDEHSAEFQRIIGKVEEARSWRDKPVHVLSVYEIKRKREWERFTNAIFNRHELFHGSKYENWLGILSRGLLLPDNVTQKLGVKRTDVGLLGSGIYFAQNPLHSLKFCSAGNSKKNKSLFSDSIKIPTESY